MKTSSDKLFTLIKSLAKNEKRYFKRSSQLHKLKEGNQYLLLFDAIEQQEVYDEEKIKKQI